MIKFQKYYVTNGEIKARIFYSISSRADKREAINLYAKDYDSRLGKIFTNEYKNESDLMTDYFDQGHVTLFSDHPLYPAALKRIMSNQKK